MPLLVATLLVIAASGCSNGRYPVKGVVTFDGNPVERGTIVFEPADRQGPVTGGTISRGQYELAGNAAPFPGKKIVRVFAAKKTGRMVEVKYSNPKVMADEIVHYIPDIYNAKTTLSCEVADRTTNQIDFDLKSIGIKKVP
jgi:hypothetical protein